MNQSNKIKNLLLFLSLILFGRIEEAFVEEDRQEEGVQGGHVTYKGQVTSSINWKNLDVEKWLDLREWKLDKWKREMDPYLTTKRRDNQFRELMGRFLSCINECRIYRGIGYANASFKSSVREGDEIQTGEDSYAWVFLMDGTLVRLSPLSSVSFQEINIGEKEIFLYARLNSGFFHWYSRSSQTFLESDLSETDSLFLPVRWYEANLWEENKVDLPDKDLAQYLDPQQIHLKQIRRLNSLIAENNKKLVHKPTYTFLVMPNGSVFGRDLRLLAYVIFTHESYIKQQTPQRLFYDTADPASDGQTEKVEPKAPIEFYYRGYQNKEVFSLEEGKWYQIDNKGKAIEPYEDGEKIFGPQEFLTSRIPTLLVARELMLRHYSLNLFDPNVSSTELARQHGYRLWRGLFEEGDKIELGNLNFRWNYLKEYTRRIETTNLFSAFTLFKRLYGDELPPSPGYLPSFHHRAFQHYLTKLSQGNQDHDDMHGTHLKLWRMKSAAGNP